MVNGLGRNGKINRGPGYRNSFPKLRSPCGMTLIESMVAGTIGVIVVMGVLTVMNVHSREVAEGTVHGILQVQSEVVYDEIGRQVRKGATVYTPTDPNPANVVEDPTMHIDDASGAVVARFRILDDTLREWNGTEWQPLMIGGDAVWVDGASTFRFTVDKKHVSPKLVLKSTYHGRDYSIPSRGGQFACRN